MCSCKWRSIYWPVFFQLAIGPHGSWNQEADLKWESGTPSLLLCICQGEKWLVPRACHPYLPLNYFSWTHIPLQAVVDVELFLSLVLCIQEPEIPLKRIATSPQWYREAFSRVSTDSGGCRSDCSLVAQMILNPGC